VWQYRLIWGVAITLLIAMVWALIFSDHGYQTYRSEQAETMKIHQQIVQLKQQREKLAKEILLLRNDPAALERLVHERLGFVHPDEYIILQPDGVSP